MSDTRIAQICGNMTYGGVASVVMNYYRHIDRSRFQFDFYSYGPSPHDAEIKALGGRVFYIKPFDRPFRAAHFLYNALKGKDYQIVHSHLNTLNCFTLKAAERAGVPVRIAHNHSTSFPFEPAAPVKAVLKRFIRRFATHLCACSRYSAEWIYGKRADRAFIARNAVDTDRYKFDSAARERLRAELGLEGKLVIGHAGRFVRQKNHKFLIKMMKKVAAGTTSPRPPVLVLAGSGKLMPKIQRLVKKHELGDEVIFLGEREDLDKAYSAFDVLALPSHYEGLPLVALEAETSGLPVVLSDKITAEACVVNCSRLALKAGLWAERILSYKDFAREDASDIMKEAGFDIRLETKRLEEYYTIEKVNR